MFEAKIYGILKTLVLLNELSFHESIRLGPRRRITALTLPAAEPIGGSSDLWPAPCAVQLNCRVPPTRDHLLLLLLDQWRCVDGLEAERRRLRELQWLCAMPRRRREGGALLRPIVARCHRLLLRLRELWLQHILDAVRVDCRLRRCVRLRVQCAVESGRPGGRSVGGAL